MQKQQRIVYLDLLRIFATFVVVMLHTTGSKWYLTTPSGYDWQIFNFFDGIARWCVPVFVMISGALFLKAEVNIEKLYKKNILRIVTAFIFWSVIYGLYRFVVNKCSLKIALGEMLVGHYHLWFLFMIAGLYLAVPILKKITESAEITRYFLILSLAFSFILPQGMKLLSVFVPGFNEPLETISQNINFHVAVGYSGYFVLGYVLSERKLDKKQRSIIYILSVVGFLGTVVLASIVSVLKKEPIDVFDDYFSVTVLLESVGIFTLFKNMKLSPSDKAISVISKLSKYSFGVYLVHALFLETLDKFGIDVYWINPIISIPVITVITLILSFAVSAILNRIPILKKYIV